MFKLFCSLLFFYCALATPTRAENTLLSNNGFVIAKAVKLGRKAVNQNTDWTNVNTGKNELFKDCNDPKCSKCDNSTGICMVCNSGYYLNNKLCQSCSNIKINNGSCIQCSSDGSCQDVTCEQGYIKKDNSCKTCAQIYAGCTECNASQCTKCVIGKYLSYGRCTTCPENATCDGTNFKCNPYFIRGLGAAATGCVRCPDNCISCRYQFGELMCF